MIDQLAKQLFNDLSAKFNSASDAGDASASQLKVIIESALRKLNLVTREEFDAQQAVLLRTREKIAALEAKLTEFEKAYKG
ncbi:accessory factor UbiK family protein [Teredinibacter waterburyi]|uniref:accessory factor UbiK family protein n=1 Tax=Teredinibacter waterburyi TaxID=1500538 RepID=UPI00165ED897|nr:accessory factor UbiK family protein [Teredinibacter waterburyi]